MRVQQAMLPVNIEYPGLRPGNHQDRCVSMPCTCRSLEILEYKKKKEKKKRRGKNAPVTPYTCAIMQYS